MAGPQLDLIRGIYEDFAKGDVSGVLGRMNPSIIWNEAENFPYADGNPYVGPQAVAAGVFARCASEWDGFAVEVEELIDGGNTIVVLVRYLGKYKTTGRSQRTQAVHVWRIENGKIVRFQQYADTLQVANVIGSR